MHEHVWAFYTRLAAIYAVVDARGTYALSEGDRERFYAWGRPIPDSIYE